MRGLHPSYKLTMPDLASALLSTSRKSSLIFERVYAGNPRSTVELDRNPYNIAHSVDSAHKSTEYPNLFGKTQDY